jgi:hypothetical protein
MSVSDTSTKLGQVARATTALTMSVAEFAAVSGLTEYTIRQEVALDRIPHRRCGRRGLVRILRLPALAALGAGTESA